MVNVRRYSISVWFSFGLLIVFSMLKFWESGGDSSISCCQVSRRRALAHRMLYPFGSYLPPIPFIMVDSSFLFVWFIHSSGHIVIPITHTAITTSGQKAMIILTSMTRRLSPVSSFCLWFIFGIPIENAQLLPDVFCFVCRFYGFW